MENKFVKILDEITVEGKVEFLQKVAKCKTAYDVIALVEKLGRSISYEDAADLLDRVKNNPISFATPIADDESQNVAGGGCCRDCGNCSDNDACGDYLNSSRGTCFDWDRCNNNYCLNMIP